MYSTFSLWLSRARGGDGGAPVAVVSELGGVTLLIRHSTTFSRGTLEER
jgi:hypothetical protein